MGECKVVSLHNALLSSYHHAMTSYREAELNDLVRYHVKHIHWYIQVHCFLWFSLDEATQ